MLTLMISVDNLYVERGDSSTRERNRMGERAGFLTGLRMYLSCTGQTRKVAGGKPFGVMLCGVRKPLLWPYAALWQRIIVNCKACLS